MPAVSKAQQQAAGAELGRRRRGVKTSKKRAFGTASIEDLRDFARGPQKGKPERVDRKAMARRLQK